MATTITNVSLTLLAPTVRSRNPKSSILRKPASVCFSNLGSLIFPRLAVATSSSFNKHLSADGFPRSAGRKLGRVRASSRDEEDEKRATATWHYQLFSVLKLLIGWCFRLICYFFVFIWFTWLMMVRSR